MITAIIFDQLFQTIISVLVVISIILLARYLFLLLKEKTYYPEQWSYFLKKKKISETIMRLEKSYEDKVRFYNFWFQIERLKKEKIPGAFAELGVYKGETAKVIHHMDSSRPFYLFDTFEGFMKEDLQNETGEAATYSPKNFADTNENNVLKYIDGNKNIILHKGHFPETTVGLKDEKFALVNIDADLYNPIKEGCEFFYPRLVEGGVLIIHDYNHKWEGTVKAVNEFAKKIPETFIEIADMYGTVMVIKNKK